MGCSQKVMVKGPARQPAFQKSVLAHRLIGGANLTYHHVQQLDIWTTIRRIPVRPYPFYLAYGSTRRRAAGAGLETSARSGDALDWRADASRDGIRGQLIVRGGRRLIGA